MIGNIFKQSYQTRNTNRSVYYINKMAINYNSKKGIHQLYFSNKSGYITISQFLKLGNLSCFYNNLNYFLDKKTWKRPGLDLIKVPNSFSFFSGSIFDKSIIMTRYIIIFQRKIRELIIRRKYREIFLLQASLFRNNIDLPRDIVRTIYTYL